MLSPKVWTALSLFLVIIFSLLIRLPYLNVPLERDEGGYAYIAWRMEQGELPYKDVFDNKPPLIYFIYLLIFKVFGHSVKAIHCFLLLWVLAEVFLIYKLCRQLFHEDSLALLAAAIFAFVTSEPGVLGFTANTEIFMLLPIIGSYVLLLKSEKGQSAKWLAICGLLNGIAFMIKPVGLYNFAGIIIYLSYTTLKDPDQKRLRKEVSYLAAGFLMIPVLLLFYFWMKGSVATFLYWAFGYNIDYMAVGGSLLDKEVLITFLRRFFIILKSDLFFYVLCLYAFISCYKIDRRAALLLITWFVMSFIGVTSGKRFFPHYFVQLIPPLAVGAAWGMRRLLDRKSQALKLSLILLIVFVPLKANYQYLFKYTPKEISSKLYGVNPFAEASEIATYINSQTSPVDTIAILGSEPEMLYYAQRKSASRYIYFNHILWLKDQKKVLIRQQEAVDEIESNHPKFIIAININASVGKLRNTPEYLFDKMKYIIKQDYCLDGFIFIFKEVTIYTFGMEQVKKRQYLLKSDQAQIMIYRRNRS